MLSASQQEYESLKRETSELRDCITKYIGYILTVAGISGFAKYYRVDVDVEKINVAEAMYFMALALWIITFIYEIIVYKIKSHNRHVGYMQLLMQEEGVIRISELTENDIAEKKYIFGSRI